MDGEQNAVSDSIENPQEFGPVEVECYNIRWYLSFCPNIVNYQFLFFIYKVWVAGPKLDEPHADGKIKNPIFDSNPR